MKQCKALLKKELNTNRFSFLMPLWFTLCVYAVVLFAWIFSQVRGDGVIVSMQTELASTGNADLVIYIASMLLTALLGLISILTTIGLADNVINGGHKHRCEILHFSQPMSFVKIALSKFVFAIKGSILLLGALSLITSLLVSWLLSSQIGTPFQYGLVGWLQSWIQVSLSVLLLGSLAWFFAGLFKKNSLYLGMLVVLGLEVTRAILNYTARWNIPSPLGYLMDKVSVNIHFNPDQPHAGLPNLNLLISQGWQSILSWSTLLKLAASAVFTVAGAWLYKFRELN